MGTGNAQYNRGYVTSNLYFNGTNWITSTVSGAGFNDFSGIQFANGGSLNLIAGQVATDTTNLGTSLDSYIRARVLTNGTMLVTSLGTGTVYSNAGSLTNTNPSDIRLKKNILNINDTLSKILNLRPVTFNWKSNEEPSIGFIAQEVEPIFPELVRTETDGYKGLLSTEFIPLLVKGIQEQQTQITSLQSITTDFITQFKAGLIETKKLVVDGVDILKKLNELSVKVESQQRQIEELKKAVEELKK